MDMNVSYENEVRRHRLNAEVVFELFHVIAKHGLCDPRCGAVRTDWSTGGSPSAAIERLNRQRLVLTRSQARRSSPAQS